VRILLDTHWLYDLMEAPGKLPASEQRLLADRNTQLFSSAVSIWEMRLKFHARHRDGARKSRFDPNDVLAALEDLAIPVLAMTPAHAARPLELPLPHRDPFDELLLVQAQEEGLKLLTHDRLLIGHPLAVSPGAAA